MRVHRGQELRYSVVDLDAGGDRGGAYAFGVACDYEVAEVLNDEIERWRNLTK